MNSLVNRRRRKYLHREKVNHDLVFVSRCENAALNQNDEDWEHPKEFFTPSPKWVDQKRADEKKLKVNCKIPTNIIALK